MKNVTTVGDRYYIDVTPADNGFPFYGKVTRGVVRDTLRTRVDGRMYDVPEPPLDVCIQKIKNWIKMGHTSVIEHFTFSFYLSISRVASHQIVRHRIASYTQTTMRVLRNFTTDDFVIPPQIKFNDLDEWVRDMQEAAKTYQKWLDKGYGVDVARRMVPAGFRTGIRVTINARSLRNLLDQRLDKHADFEIRDIATDMYKLLRDAGYGFLFEDLELVKSLQKEL